MSSSTTRTDDLWGHPRGLYICFATELWERFSFYGMKYLLLLYLTKYHLFSDAAGLGVLGSYASLVYAMPVLGGLIADRFIGMRKAVTFGGLLLVAGHLGMAYEGDAARQTAEGIVRDDAALSVFYLSLALIVVGVGFLKPNISTVVGKLYAEGDARRDSGFTIFYMGINVGAFAATLLCGWLGEVYGWTWGFGAAGIGMLIGLIMFQWGQKFLDGHGQPPDLDVLLRPAVLPGLTLERAIYLGSLLMVAVVWQLVQLTDTVGTLLDVLSLVVLAGLGWFLLVRCNKVERERMFVLIVLTLSTVVFWALFEQAAGSMTLYADRVTDKTLLGVTVTAAQFGAANAFFIFLLAPPFALLWTRLSKAGWEPATPVKFSLGIAQAGLGFGALVYGAQFPDEAGMVSAWWLVLAYLLHTMGELCLSPVGLSAVTKLAVPSVVGVMMGTWFLASAYSSYVAAQIATVAAQPVNAENVNVSDALSAYTDLFGQLLSIGLAGAAALLLLSPLLKRMMHGIR
ncbi:MAG: peptide MFS transporter [Luminiphilus sp.]|jgi:proton-dependent oligopeptide transporter, POT family|nr:peptide MFS transporter [Luminiphilus sp.]